MNLLLRPLASVGLILAAAATAGLLALSSSAIAATAPTAPTAPTAADGKALFLSFECNECHAVKSHGIEPLEELKDPKDLSKVGAERDRDWIVGWLTRKITKTKKRADGQEKTIQHKKKWKGTDAERDAIISWLLTLK